MIEMKPKHEHQKARQQQHAESRIALNSACLNALTSPNGDLTKNGWQRIGDNFDLLYDCLENVNALRQAILQLAVMGRLVPQDSKDEPASVLLKKIKAEKQKLIKEGKIRKPAPLPPIEPGEVPYQLPEGWVVVRLGEVLLNGKSSYGKNPSPNLVNVWVVKVGNVSNDGFLHGRFADRGYPPSKISELLVCTNDLLVVKSSGSAENVRSGKTAICRPEEEGNMVASNFVMRLQRFSSEIDATFLWRLMNSPISREFVEKTVKTFTYPNLKWSDLSRWALGLPPLAEQKRIVAKVDQLMALCDDLEAKLKQSQSAAETLMGAVVHELTAA